MAIIKEIQDAIKAVADTIKNVQNISKAIREGIDYLKTQHPEVAEDLAAMCEEMRKTSQAIASASSIITHFRFVIGDDLSGQATRFNDHFISHKAQAEQVRHLLESMRGHCSVIKDHANEIGKKADAKGLKSLFSILGLHSEKRENELANDLYGIYDEESRYHLEVYAMAQAIELSLKSIQDALGPPGIIDPLKVPEAALVLGEHAEMFSRIESDCNFNALQLQTSIDQLKERVA